MTVPHQALYRRWRAQTFAGIVGQEAVVATLRNAVRTGRVAHALLFVGPRGTGKTSMARIVAKAINCTDLRDGEPCDRCPSCVAIREGRAMDVVEMDAASNNRVDDIRELLPRIHTAPSDVRRKVFIVDEVQRIKEGWDVLLKTLEEPPDHVAFIFCTTDPSQIRPAVLSRVQRYDFRRLTVPEIEGKLRTILADEGATADDEAVELVAHLAEGGMRDAESMLDQLLSSGTQRLEAGRVRELIGLADADEVAAFVRALVEPDPGAGLRILASLEDRGRDVRVFLDQVVDALRGELLADLAAGRGDDVPTLADAATRLAAIDPARGGPGGLRLQLELALLASHEPSTSTRSTGASAASGTPTATRTARSGSGHGGTEATPSVATRATGSGETAPVTMPATEVTAATPVEREPIAPGPDLAIPSPATEPAAAVVSAPEGRPRRSVATEPRPDAPTPPPGAPPLPATPGTTATERREPAPAELPATPGEVPDGGPATPTTAGELAALRDQWPEIVAFISQHPPTKPLIAACRPVAVDGNVVTLGFPEGQAFLKDVAERRRGNLEEGIARFLGHPVAVRCIATNVDRGPELPADAESQRLVDEARRIFADDLADVGEVG